MSVSLSAFDRKTSQSKLCTRTDGMVPLWRLDSSHVHGLSYPVSSVELFWNLFHCVQSGFLVPTIGIAVPGGAPWLILQASSWVFVKFLRMLQRIVAESQISSMNSHREVLHTQNIANNDRAQSSYSQEQITCIPCANPSNYCHTLRFLRIT